MKASLTGIAVVNGVGAVIFISDLAAGAAGSAILLAGGDKSTQARDIKTALRFARNL